MGFKDIHLYCRNESYVIHIIWLWVLMVLHIALVGGDGMIINGGIVIRSCFDAITMFVCVMIQLTFISCLSCATVQYDTMKNSKRSTRMTIDRMNK